MPTRLIPIEGSLDLRSSLRPLHGTFGPDGWWMAARTPAGTASLRVTRSIDGVVGKAWGSGADRLLERLPDIAGLTDDPASFRTDHRLVAELHRRHPGLRVASTGQVFDHLLVAIVGQKVTGAEAARSMRGLAARFSDPAPGPNRSLRLPPEPAALAATPYWDFHELGLEKKRADTIRRAAQMAREIDALGGQPPAKAAETLTAIPGVGEWTITETLVRSHGDADALSVGDYHLKNVVVYHLTGRPRGTDDEMVDLLEEFRPHRARVVRLLLTMGGAPKYGPRSVPRDFRNF